MDCLVLLAREYDLGAKIKCFSDFLRCVWQSDVGEAIKGQGGFQCRYVTRYELLMSVLLRSFLFLPLLLSSLSLLSR